MLKNGDTLGYQNIKCLFLTETAGGFKFGVQIVQLFSENKVDLTKVAELLGQYFQIRDDYCSLCLQQVTLSYKL
jgi:geranylgeranyl diphosphate synthase type 3